MRLKQESFQRFKYRLIALMLCLFSLWFLHNTNGIKMKKSDIDIKKINDDIKCTKSAYIFLCRTNYSSEKLCIYTIEISKKKVYRKRRIISCKTILREKKSIDVDTKRSYKENIFDSTCPGFIYRSTSSDDHVTINNEKIQDKNITDLATIKPIKTFGPLMEFDLKNNFRLLFPVKERSKKSYYSTISSNEWIQKIYADFYSRIEIILRPLVHTLLTIILIKTKHIKLRWDLIYCCIFLFPTLFPTSNARFVKACNDTLCILCPEKDRDICFKCENISMCETKHIDYDFKPMEQRFCLEECPDNTFMRNMNKAISEKMCCETCSNICLDGCTGNSSYAEKFGCNRCRYGVFDKFRKTFKCLIQYPENICQQNNYYNHYIVKHPEPIKAKYECRPCHSSCTDCSESDGCMCGNNLMKKVLHDGTIMCEPSKMDKNSTVGNNPGSNNNSSYIIIGTIACLIIIILIIIIGMFYKNLSIRVFNRNTSFHDFNADRIDSSTTEPFLDRVVTRSSYHGTRVNKDQSIDLNYSRPSFTTAPPTSPISIISSNNHKDSNERLQMIKPHELNIINGGILGRGEFGEVYKGIWQDQDVAVKILKDSNPTTVKAIEFLHKNDIVHGDLAARNVLVVNRNHIEVSDFGLAKHLHGTRGYLNNGKAAIQWLSLECLKNHILTQKNDVWAFGVTVWEIFTYGRTPYEDENIKSVAQLIKFLQEDGSRLSQPEDCCIDTFSAMLLCWMKEQERANISIIRAEFEKIYLTKTSKNDPMAYHVSLASNLYDTP